LRRDTDAPFDIDDISGFIKLIALVEGLPLHVIPERDAEIFRTRAQRRIIERLPDPDVARAPWIPDRRDGDLFPADLWLPAAADRNVVAFFAASTRSAERSMAFVGEYARWDLDVKPVLVHDGRLNSRTIHRAQIVMDDTNAVVAANERATDTGFLPVVRVLRMAGVTLN
jgi:hypothetical protein